MDPLGSFKIELGKSSPPCFFGEMLFTLDSWPMFAITLDLRAIEILANMKFY